MDIAVHSKKSLFQQKFKKKLYHFNSNSQSNWISGVRRKNLTPTASVAKNPTPPKNLWFRNPGGRCKWVSCFDLRCCAFLSDGQMSTRWSRCPGSMSCHDRDIVAPLWQSSAGWMPTKMSRLSAGVEQMHPMIVCEVLLMTRSIKQVLALRHWAGAQYSAVECTKAKVIFHNVVTWAQASKPSQEWNL